MAQGRSTKIISMMKWTQTSRLSIKNSITCVATRTSPTGRSVLEAKALLMRTFSVVPSGTVSPSGVWRSDHVRRTIVTVFEA